MDRRAFGMGAMATLGLSACASASLSPSYVLKAMGLSDTDAHSSVRFSLGRYTSEEDIERAIEHIHQVVAKLQSA